MSRIFPAFSGSLVWLVLGPAAMAAEPPVPPADDDLAPAYSPIDQSMPAALLARRIRPVVENAGPPRPPGVTAQAGAPPQRLATSLPTTNRIPRVDDAPIPPAPIAEAVPGTVTAAEPKQISTYESTGVPDPFAPSVESVDSPAAAPLEPLGRQTEVVRERYPNGAVMIERHVTQDENRNYLNHGPWAMWDSGGNPVAKGQYRLGQREGTWVRQYFHLTDGLLQHVALRAFQRPLISTAEFSEGELHGEWTVVDADGRNIAVWNFEQGKLHGQATWWHASGKTMRIANYVDGVPHGDFTEWRADGVVTRHVEFEHGNSYAAFTQNYPDGKIRVQGWHAHPAEEHRLNFDWWTGNVQIEAIRAQGRPDRTGVWTYFYANGMKEYEGEFQDGTPIGSHSWWHSNGQRMIRGNYLDGKAHGNWTWWYANGLRRIEGSYVHGEHDLGWIGWTENGHAVSLDDQTDSIPQPPTVNEDPQKWSSARADDGPPSRTKIGYY